MILIIDNYDSFTYNLVQLVGTFRPDVKVVRNDALSVAEIDALAPDGIIISPARVSPATPGYPCRWWNSWPENTPSSGCAWGTRLYVKPSELP